jgi:hypothetical protein
MTVSPTAPLHALLSVGVGVPRATTEATLSRRRKRGSGGVVAVRDGVWRVDLEISHDPVSGRRQRVSRTVVGSREDTEIALARLKLADHEKRLPSGGTTARSVQAAFQLYPRAVEAGLVELAPRTKVTVRSAAKDDVIDAVAGRAGVW